MCAEFFQLLVQSKTWWLGRDFKKHAAGFAEIDGMKIRPIDHWGDVITKLDELLAPLQLFGFILRPERNVMHRTRSDPARPGVGQTKQIDDSAGCRVVWRGKTKPVARFLEQRIAKTVGE